MEYISTQSLFKTYKKDRSSVERAVEIMSESGSETRGAVFTRREIVDFILDLVGYTPDKPLHTSRLLEPSFGQGDFIIPVIQRIINAYRKENNAAGSFIHLKNAIKAVELHKSSFLKTKENILDLLKQEEFSEDQSMALIDSWLIQGDYLLTPFEKSFNYVVGNPPYVRQEFIPSALITEYRKHYHTIFDRADLYIPFIEKSLLCLAKGGSLGFICSDRWMKNRYGGPLRQMIADHFHLKIYVDMVDTPSFLTEVSAYPAITVITNENPGKTTVCHKPDIENKNLKKLAKALLSKKDSDSGSSIKTITNVAVGAEPWLIASYEILPLLRRLERCYPDLEKAGCKVGIGVATGADKAFIGSYDEMDVEPDRKLPLVTTKDIETGMVKWNGHGIINPFSDNGSLVDLNLYPKLKRYLEDRKDTIAMRHVARKAPLNWYRTIDRIYPELTTMPKLLIPDIKGEPNIVFEAGHLYPHHNLYYILSHEWNLEALRAVMLSGIAHLFVSMYSTRIRGGYLRYQAQYLRRIRLPRWQDVPADLKTRLIKAAENDNKTECNNLVSKLYGLSDHERAIMESYAI